MNRFEKHRRATLTVILVVGCLAMLALVETTLRLTGGVPTDRAPASRYITLREWPPNSALTFRAPRNRTALTGDGARETYSLDTDADGFIKPSRAHARPDLTVVFLGGSTTEALFVDADKRFPVIAGRVLQDRSGLKVNALNSGRSGNNITHANHLLSGKIVPLQPDYVVLMEAVNDLGVLLRLGTYWPDDGDFAQVGWFPRSVSQAIRQIRDALIPETAKAFRKASALIRTSMRAQAQTSDPNSGDIVRAFGAYESALRQFIGTSRAWKIRPVLMTQALLVGDAARGAGREGDYLDPSLLARLAQTPDSIGQLHELQNNIVRRLAAELDVPLIDLARDLPRDPNLFYDGMHYGNRGSVAAGELIGTRLAEIAARDRQR